MLTVIVGSASLISGSREYHNYQVYKKAYEGRRNKPECTISVRCTECAESLDAYIEKRIVIPLKDLKEVFGNEDYFLIPLNSGLMSQIATLFRISEQDIHEFIADPGKVTPTGIKAAAKSSAEFHGSFVALEYLLAKGQPANVQQLIGEIFILQIY